MISGDTDVRKEGLSINEAVMVSGLGRSSLYKALSRGDLVARKFGSRNIILRSDLMRFLEALPCGEWDVK